MVMQLRGLVAPAEDPGSVPSTTGELTNIKFQGTQCPFLTSWISGTHVVHITMHRQSFHCKFLFLSTFQMSKTHTMIYSLGSAALLGITLT